MHYDLTKKIIIMKIKSCLQVLALAFIPLLSFSQTITGIWKSVDDEDGLEKSHIEIYQEDGKTYGKIIKLLEAAEGTHCDECPGDLKGAPITGMVILKDMEGKGKKLEGGTILDPASGKTYSCNIELVEDNKLKLRGYIGFSLLGRTQYWHRVE